MVLIGEATKAMHAAEADAALDGKLEAALQNHSIKDAAALVAAELDLPKREVYARALALAEEGRMRSAARAPPRDLPARPSRRMDRAAVPVLKGYRPLARRYAAAGGEIDLIVMRGDTIAFVEVKARGLMDDALIAITARKRQRFSRAARAWLSRNAWAADQDMARRRGLRRAGRWPRHLVAAFELEMGA